MLHFLFIFSINPYIDQLKQLKKITLARLLCDNSDDIQKMQRQAFRKISDE